MVFSSKSISGIREGTIQKHDNSEKRNIHIYAEVLNESTITRLNVNGEGSYTIFLRGIIQFDEGNHTINQQHFFEGSLQEAAGLQQSSDYLVLITDANDLEIKISKPATVSLEMLVLSKNDYIFEAFYEPSNVTYF